MLAIRSFSFSSEQFGGTLSVEIDIDGDVVIRIDGENEFIASPGEANELVVALRSVVTVASEEREEALDEFGF